MKRMEEKKQGDLEVFGWFRTHVIDVKLEHSIHHQELVSVVDNNLLCCSFAIRSVYFRFNVLVIILSAFYTYSYMNINNHSSITL